ncbi:DUF190 domain-containing protein [Candidatus Electronema sp. JM]|uniref:DUF190 domain-containing protein n=1 Tax=Candidatus Electronema sp. JM TaxID=3401571 RepID=UPI003AA91789
MPFRWDPREHVALGAHVLKWLALAGPTAAVIGTACALFLWALEQATRLRFAQPWLLWLLPLAGALIAFLYTRFGHAAEGGNNLLMDAVHGQEQGDDSAVIVPGLMAPLILTATVITHLFGGSAGREGTAVQMGGSIAALISRRLGLNREDTRSLLLSGIAAGFAGVFGTPLTGTVFAMEVLTIGRMSYDAIIPCLIAAIVSNWTTLAWGGKHTHYVVTAVFMEASPAMSWLLVVKISAAAVCFGLASVLFAELTHSVSHAAKRLVRSPYLRPVMGGLLLIALVHLLGTRDYLGLGVSAAQPGAVTLVSAFQPGGADTWSWWWKLLFTALTLGTGFKGGEVTPLFFIGATLGNVLGQLLAAPADLFAALGFVAVFAGATNTPLACTIMGVELFGSEYTLPFAIACFVAYLFSGHSGSYLSQRIGTPKIAQPHLPPNASLRLARELRPGVGILSARLSSEGEQLMPHRRYAVHRQAIGQVRIYMTPSARRTTGRERGLWRLFGPPPLYMEIIRAAKEHGLLNATAHHSHYGYSGIQTDRLESPNPSLNLCVEIIGPHEELESFCRKHSELLHDKVIVFKELERWQLHEQQDGAAAANAV